MTVFFVFVGATLLAAACWAYARRRAAAQRRARSKAAVSGESARQHFAGARIRVGARACAAAHALAGEMFLASEAPALPLVDCDEARCQCAFVKLADRRDGESRRWADEGISALVYSAKERRALRDRRDAGTGHLDQ